MAREGDDGRPLSLNERLAMSLSSSRPTIQRPEARVRKVKLDGRRRLCKLSSRPDSDSPDGASPRGDETDSAGGDSIRGILDDLSSRLESLSVERSRPRFPPDPRDSEPEFISAPSSLSPSPPEVEGGRAIAKVKVSAVKPLALITGKGNMGGTSEGIKGKAAEHLVLDEEGSEEGDCVAVGNFKKWGEGDYEAGEDLSDSDGGDPIRFAGIGNCKDLMYKLPGWTARMLYPHQREGLKWLWSLHCHGTGGILGDDMGLGKTMLVSAFLAGLFHSRLIKRVLLLSPKTLIGHWLKELSVVGLSSRIRDYSGTSQKMREYELQNVFKEGGILLTTYDIVRNNSTSLRGDRFVDESSWSDDILWDYTILDEGHIIKNPQTQRAKSLFEIPSRHRIIISGTPIQNNLKELWALFHFCCPEILGGKDEFKLKFENPILRGNDKHASDREKYVGSTVAKELRERIMPYFLRRMKSDVFNGTATLTTANISKKNEIIIWLKLTSVQRQLYEAFLNSDLVHSSVSGSPLAAITILKKICDHPMLLTKRAAEGVLEGIDSMLNREEIGMVEEMALSLASMANQNAVLKLDQNASCKLSFMASLLENLINEGHHVLIFSQTRKMLNLVQEAITSQGYKFVRIDGTTKASDREVIVKDFQEGCEAPIFLLTSQVGGLGLTLTRADRVIVVDPAWNPSTDNQSVDRAYRIGQTRDVLVYRLMTCGTVEEKIYKMQVFKGGLFKTATEQREQTRYFSQKDIRELFSLPPQGFDVSLTQQQLYEEHDRQHTLDDALKNHIEFLRSQGIAGVSHHSLLFSKTAITPSGHDDSKEHSETGDHIVRSSPSGSSTEQAVNAVCFQTER
ncbi:DNA repair and recombination protein RAD54 [Apostasia shenzhenica]|uniref:DNA repair and recombination protein RAD54 n=1 Tax=Apostasia shenzhenica TaxID=1088818 RepID=A0A2I0BAF9_9ASPA|nr:DNA repair and recombination protein RAD54 [Apostasia shenzhenica]